MKTLKLWILGPIGFFILCATIPAGIAGGRTGTGGEGPCDLTPEQLKEAFPKWDGKIAVPPSPPPVSVVDPTTKQEPQMAGCAIPTGELELAPPKPIHFPGENSESRTCKNLPEVPAVVYESRIAPSDGCRSIELWNFVRELGNQRRYHAPPVKCQAWNGDVKNSYSGYSCQKVAFFESREDALKAKAPLPFAYLANGRIHIDFGQLFLTSMHEIIDAHASRGKVRGERIDEIDQRSLDAVLSHQKELQESSSPDCSVSDAVAKDLSCAYPGQVQKSPGTVQSLNGSGLR